MFLKPEYLQEIRRRELLRELKQRTIANGDMLFLTDEEAAYYQIFIPKGAHMCVETYPELHLLGRYKFRIKRNSLTHRLLKRFVKERFV